MARLLRERSRKPIVENAVAFPGTKFLNNELHFTLEIGEPWNHGKEIRYIAALTRPEAMRIMSEWLKTMVTEDAALRRSPSTPSLPQHEQVEAK